MRRVSKILAGGLAVLGLSAGAASACEWGLSKSRGAKVYGYGPVYAYGPNSGAPKSPQISGYGPSYAPNFGAGYPSQSTKLVPNGWVEPRRSPYR